MDAVLHALHVPASLAGWAAGDRPQRADQLPDLAVGNAPRPRAWAGVILEEPPHADDVGRQECQLDLHSE